MGLFRLSIVMYRFCRFPIHIFKTCIIFGKTYTYGESIDVSGGLKEQKDEYSTTDNRIT